MADANTPAISSFRYITTLWPVPSRCIVLLQRGTSQTALPMNPASCEEQKKGDWYCSTLIALF